MPSCRWKSLLSLTLLFLISDSHYLCQTLEPVPQHSQVPLIHKVELLNGLRVVIVQTNAAPRIALNLLIKAGSALDSPKKAGAAYLTAQSLRFSNQRETADYLSEEIEDLGAELKIRVDQDSTVFQAEVPSQNLGSFLDLMSHMVLRPLFSSDGVEKLKQALIRSKIESPDPVEFARQSVRSRVFGKHPYGRSVYGGLQSVASIRSEDLEEFYKTYYCPNNSVLVIAGSLETSYVGRLAREKLGGWVKGARVELELPLVPIQEALSVLVVKDKHEQVAIAFGLEGPPRITPDFYAVTVMNLILGGPGNGSRLAQGFLARSINYQFLQSEFQFASGGGLFQVTTVVPSSFVASALETVLEMVETLKSSPIKESELAAAKQRLLAWHGEVLSSPSLLVDQVTSQELYDLASDFLVSFPKRVQKVTKERVEEVSKNYLSTSRAAVVIVGACDDSIPELQKLGALDITERTENHQKD